MNIGILTGCSSDRHLSESIYNELKLLGMHPFFITLTQNNIVDSYHHSNYCFEQFKYDFVLAVGDRAEQMGGVLAAFQNKIPIGHLYSGDLNTGVSDDIHRAAITLYSNIQFCSCLESTENTIRLMRSAGLVPDANFVKATHFDNIDIQNIKDVGLSVKPYILILINSETLGDNTKLIRDTVTEFMSLDKVYNVIIAKGNGDDSTIEKAIFNAIIALVDNITSIVNENRKDHEYFLSLIKNCDYFITNSSAIIYEAPALVERNRIIHIGNRNKNRTMIPLSSHDGLASKRVANLIKTFLEART